MEQLISLTDLFSMGNDAMARSMVKVFKFGLMDPDTKVSGKMIKLTAREL